MIATDTEKKSTLSRIVEFFNRSELQLQVDNIDITNLVPVSQTESTLGIKTANKSSKEIITELGSIQQEYVINTRYDTFTPVLEFIQTYSKFSQEIDETISEVNGENNNFAKPDEIDQVITVFSNFKHNTENNVKKTGGTSCVGQSIQFRDILRSKGYPAFCPPVVLPQHMREGNPTEYGHIAVVIPFENPDDPTDAGYILCDPGLSMTKPIVIRKGESNKTKPWNNAQEWTFTYQDNPPKILCDVMIPNSQGGGQSEFLVDKEWQNPDEILTKLSVMNQRPRMAVRDENGDYHAEIAIWIGKKGAVTCTIGTKDENGTYKRTHNKMDTIELTSIINDDFAKQFYPDSISPKDEMIENIQSIAQWLPLAKKISMMSTNNT